MSKTCRTHAASIYRASRLWRHSYRAEVQWVSRQLPLSWRVIPMVPPVLMTRTRASVVEGEVSGSIDSIELQLDNFLHLDGCSGIFLGEPTSFVPSIRFSCGCDKARARDVRLISAMTTTEVMTRSGSATSVRSECTRHEDLQVPWEFWYSAPFGSSQMYRNVLSV